VWFKPDVPGLNRCEFEIIDDKIKEWTSLQKIFFVATAPLSGDGLINCSPKGMDTFRVISPMQVAYLDYTGSGVEAMAHIRENKRIVIMMCTFEGPPKIFRFHGNATAHETGTPGFEELSSQFNALTGARSIIAVDLTRISDSCGYSVPLYDYRGDRDGLVKWAANKGPDGIQEYQRKKNLRSVEGLPGMKKSEV
jgi:hypothetical protein